MQKIIPHLWFDKEGFIKHSRFTLDGQNFMAMDSSLQKFDIESLKKAYEGK